MHKRCTCQLQIGVMVILDPNTLVCNQVIFNQAIIGSHLGIIQLWWINTVYGYWSNKIKDTIIYLHIYSIMNNSFLIANKHPSFR